MFDLSGMHQSRAAGATPAGRLNNAAASCGVSELGDAIRLKGVTPE